MVQALVLVVRLHHRLHLKKPRKHFNFRSKVGRFGGWCGCGQPMVKRFHGLHQTVAGDGEPRSEFVTEGEQTVKFVLFFNRLDQIGVLFGMFDDRGVLNFVHGEFDDFRAEFFVDVHPLPFLVEAVDFGEGCCIRRLNLFPRLTCEVPVKTVRHTSSTSFFFRSA